MIFKAIFTQVRAPRAKMDEMCEKVLITVKVMNMVLIGGPESFQVIVEVMAKTVARPQLGHNPGIPQAAVS